MPTWSYGNKGPEMKFYPHESGRKGQSVTYATVKDNIVSFIQRSYCYGKDIAVSLRDLQKKDLSAERPTRMISNKTDDDKKLEQDGFDMIYQTEIKQFLERERALKIIWIRHMHLYLELTAVKQSKVRWRNIQTMRQQSEIIQLSC